MEQDRDNKFNIVEELMAEPTKAKNNTIQFRKISPLGAEDKLHPVCLQLEPFSRLKDMAVGTNSTSQSLMGAKRAVRSFAVRRSNQRPETNSKIYQGTDTAVFADPGSPSNKAQSEEQASKTSQARTLSESHPRSSIIYEPDDV